MKLESFSYWQRGYLYIFLPQVDNSTVENRRIVYLMLNDAFFVGETLLNFDNIWLADK